MEMGCFTSLTARKLAPEEFINTKSRSCTGW
jgi:hypothetical protein